MPDIDPSKIKPGDTVRMRMQTTSMQEEGIDPIEFTTKVYAPGHPDYSALCIAGFDLAHPDLAILEHIPARPDWAAAKVVRDRHGDLWGPSGSSWRELTTDPGALIRTADFVEKKYAPITVVLDADGNPPAPAPEWLDADALKELPTGSLVAPAGMLRRWKSRAGEWCLLGGRDGINSSDIAPARLLWAPEGDR